MLNYRTQVRFWKILCPIRNQSSRENYFRKINNETNLNHRHRLHLDNTIIISVEARGKMPQVLHLKHFHHWRFPFSFLNPPLLLTLLRFRKDLQLTLIAMDNVSATFKLSTLLVIYAINKGMPWLLEFLSRIWQKDVWDDAVCIQPPDSWPAP